MKRKHPTEVSLQPHPGRPHLLRLRWSLGGSRYTLYMPVDQEQLAQRVCITIQRDIQAAAFDPTLQRYKEMLTTPVETAKELHQASPILQAFDDYLQAIGRDRNTPNYYYHVRQMLIRWGNIAYEEVPTCLLRMNYAPVTFNQRKGLLANFFNWLVKKKRLEVNPLDDLKPMRQPRLEIPMYVTPFAKVS